MQAWRPESHRFPAPRPIGGAWYDSLRPTGRSRASAAPTNSQIDVIGPMESSRAPWAKELLTTQHEVARPSPKPGCAGRRDLPILLGVAHELRAR